MEIVIFKTGHYVEHDRYIERASFTQEFIKACIEKGFECLNLTYDEKNLGWISLDNGEQFGEIDEIPEKYYFYWLDRNYNNYDYYFLEEGYHVTQQSRMITEDHKDFYKKRFYYEHIIDSLEFRSHPLLIETVKDFQKEDKDINKYNPPKIIEVPDNVDIYIAYTQTYYDQSEFKEWVQEVCDCVCPHRQWR